MKIYLIGQFAKLTDVTVKTLRHYETLDLLMPTYNPDNGYRRYHERHVQELEQIMALKLLGFGLNEISIFLKNNQHKLKLNLKVQKSAFIKKMDEIRHIVDLIDKLERLKGRSNELESWVTLLKEMKMENRNLEWYLNQSEEDMRKLSDYQPTTEETADLEQKWDDLIDRAKIQMDNFDQIVFDGLADDWIDLVRKFIKDPKTMMGLFNGYAIMASWPKDRQLFDPKVGEFVSSKLIERLNI